MSSDGSLWAEIAAASLQRRPVVLATIVRSAGSVPRRQGARMLIDADGSTRGTVGGGLFESLVARDALSALSEGRSIVRRYSFNPEGEGPDAFGAVCGGNAEVFLDVILPADRLFILGCGHCGQALARMASLLGFTIVVADDRAEFAQRERFDSPGVELVLQSAEDFSNLPTADASTYVVILTKGHESDEAALRRVVRSPAAYIGMMGSERKRGIIFDRLRSEGVPEDAIARVHAPVGLQIGAETPEEIAVSILAQILAVRSERRKSAV